MNNEQNPYKDTELKCVECEETFLFRAKDQEFYDKHGYVEPKRCFSCRKKKKERMANY